MPNGSKYEGHFEQGVLEGLGVVTNKSGETYHGEWRSGKKNGYGISQYSASSWDPDAGTYYYIGEHKDNKRDGFGFEILILKNDSISRKLVTNWSDNKPNGLGIRWVNGAFEGKYQVIYRCGR